MPNAIPTYQLPALAPHGEKLGVYFVDQRTAGTVSPQLPYRGNYYKIGLCLRGRAELKANLETYVIRPNSLMIITPHVIKEWGHASNDLDCLSVFFTREFITANHTLDPAHFQFLEAVTTHVLPLSNAQTESLAASFYFLRQKYHTPHPFRDTLVKNLISNLLYEVAVLYAQQHPTPQAPVLRSQMLVSSFRQLLHMHGPVQRSVTFYADQLCITPKYLTETLKALTGKTTGDWIEETVLLEAQVLLQNQQLTVAQVAALLHFPDQSAFSRFFKKSSGLSPTAYKNAC